MKSIKKIAGILLALVAMTICYSCNEEVEYTSAEKLNSEQVYFPSSNKASIDLSSLEQSFQIPIVRIKTDGAATVPLTATGGDGLYTIPASVTFAQGEAASVITIGYDPDALEFDSYSEIKLSIGEGYTSPYGLAEYTVRVGIPVPWESLGMATFIDIWMFEDPYSVEIQQHTLEPTRYRLVDPYTQGLIKEGYVPTYNRGNQSPYFEFQILPAGSVYKDVTTTIEGLVVYNDVNTGYYHPTYGDEVLCMHPSRFTSYSTEDTWAHNVVTQFSDEGKPEVVQMAPYFYIMAANGGWNNTQVDGVVTIVFPGAVLTDYSLEVAYSGKYTDAQDKVVGVLAQILEVGGDVESVRLAVVEGTDVDATVEEIKSGNIDFVEVAATPATVQLPFATDPVAGKYTIVAVAYGGGEAQTVASAEFKYTPPSSETWTARSTGDYLYSFFFTGVDEGLTLYQSDSDPNRWKIEHWGYDVDFVFTYNQTTGEIMVEDQEIGYLHPSYGMVMVDDLVDYTGSTNYGQSYYEDGVFYFAVIYYVKDGYFDEFGYETFTLTDGSLAPAKAKAPSSLHRENKKVQTTSTVSRKQFIRNNKFTGSPLR
jgi:hypothetical protein